MNQFPNQDILGSTQLLCSLPRSFSLHSVRNDQSLDYRETEARVAASVHRICDHLPARTSERIVIGLSDPIDVLVTLFATWVAGHCAVLVNPGLAPDEKNRVIAKTAPALWAGDDGWHPINGLEARGADWPDAALILMTSGTTGEPKGITHSLATLEARLKLNVAEIGVDTLARTLCPLPMFFGHGLIGNCLTPLYAGQTLHVLDAPGLAEFAQMGALIDRLGITFLSSVPSMWRMVLRMSHPPRHPPLRVHVGSAPLPGDLWTKIDEWCGTGAVLNTYGMTETANWISGGTRPGRDASGFVGRPWGGRFAVVRDGTLHSTGRGEVALQSPSMMLGIWGAQTQPDQIEGHFLTGDIGELAGDQSLTLVGRIKNEINRGGIKVLAEEVDMLLERHPQVAEACAFGIPDQIAGELVGAVVRAVSGSEVSTQDLIRWCRQQARAEAVPSRIALVDDIAKNDRGKLARQAIQQEMVKKWC